MFLFRQIIEDPMVLRRKNLGENKFTYRVTQAKGTFYRVIPDNWKEICYLKLLEKGDTLEVPADGDGVVIRDTVTPPQP